ncbi:MAG: alpha/beta hydrolase, partial [Brevundimonas sp.]
KSVTVPLTIVQSGDDDRVWKQTARWAAKRLGRGRYVEVAGARHEIIKETDERRAVFLEEFDALADYLAPAGTAAAIPQPAAEPAP